MHEAFPKSYMEKVANDLAAQIKKRTLLGYGVSNGNQQRLKPLSESYVKQRKRYSGNLSGDTTPKRSNLTATGQLLNAIRGTGYPAKLEITINDRRGRNLSGKSSGITNNKLLEYVSADRPFFAITKAESNKLVRELKTQLLATVRKFFGKG